MKALLMAASLLLTAACASTPAATQAPAATPTPAAVATRAACTPVAVAPDTGWGVVLGAEAPDLSHATYYKGAAPDPGQPYLLYFWGTWCKPCKAIIPELMAKATARNLPVVAFSRDRVDMLDAFFAGWTADFPANVAYEGHPNPAHKTYAAWSLPRVAIVDSDGCLELLSLGVDCLDRL